MARRSLREVNKARFEKVYKPREMVVAIARREGRLVGERREGSGWAKTEVGNKSRGSVQARAAYIARTR